jgi:hypothetical protein
VFASAFAFSGVHAAFADRPVIELQATKGAKVTLRPEHHYVPADVSFRADGVSITVGIQKVALAGRGKISSSDCRLTSAAGGKSAVSSFRFTGDKEAKLTTSVFDGRPTIRFEVSPAGGAELVIYVGGADRLVCSNGSGFATASLGAGSGKMTVRGSALVLQRRADQHGLAITAENMRIESSPGGARVHVPLASAADRAVRVEVTGFRGDAIIAHENAIRSSGGNRPQATVSQLAAQQKEAAAEPVSDTNEPAIGEWQWWTGTDRVFPPLLADPREAQVRIGVGYADPPLKFLEAGVGGDLVVAKKRFAEDQELSVSLRGLIIGRLDTCSSSFPLLNTDFFGGVATGYRRGDDAWELYLFHESSHLGDEVLEDRQRRRIDFSREAVRLLWSHDFGALRLYGGPTFNIRGFPDDIRRRTTLQLGAEYRWVAWNTPMYVACDLKSRQENNWAVDFTAQYGIELGDPAKVRNRPRIFLEYFIGHSNMGQFFNEHEKYIMLGFGYNF